MLSSLAVAKTAIAPAIAARIPVGGIARSGIGFSGAIPVTRRGSAVAPAIAAGIPVGGIVRAGIGFSCTIPVARSESAIAPVSPVVVAALAPVAGKIAGGFVGSLPVG